MKRQLSSARRYRRELEAAVAELKGGVDLHAAHLIDEATSAECHAAVCRWLLRERLDKMSDADVIKPSSEILRAKGIRNRAVERLECLTALVDEQNSRLARMSDAMEERNHLIEQMMQEHRRNLNEDDWWKDGGEPPLRTFASYKPTL